PPLPLNTAHIYNVAVTFGYVFPLYLMKHTRLSFSASPSAGVGRERVKQPEERWRDDPSVIKARLLSASISTAVACGWAYAVIRYIWKSYIPDAPSWSFIKPRLGLTLSGDTIPAYLVTPALFMGPLYVRHLQGELPFRRWTFRDVRDTFFTWTGFRNFVVGPVTEELVWRSCIIAIYHLAGVSRNFLIFFTPISFGAAHLHHGWEAYCRYGQTRQALQRAIIVTLFQFTYTTLFGFHCAFLFLRTNSVFPPIAAHVFCNLMGVP
ncbi:hypothetical protein HETIRDRAFT_240649, partial [Heterobasidion irregulare TC 32-1]